MPRRNKNGGPRFHEDPHAPPGLRDCTMRPILLAPAHDSVKPRGRCAYKRPIAVRHARV
jgi:hypothetical protein